MKTRVDKRIKVELLNFKKKGKKNSKLPFLDKH